MLKTMNSKNKYRCMFRKNFKFFGTNRNISHARKYYIPTENISHARKYYIPAENISHGGKYYIPTEYISHGGKYYIPTEDLFESPETITGLIMNTRLIYFENKYK